jgi:hypothetical protein
VPHNNPPTHILILTLTDISHPTLTISLTAERHGCTLSTRVAGRAATEGLLAETRLDTERDARACIMLSNVA